MNPFSFYIRTISFVLRRRKSRHRFFGLVVREMHFEGEISDILQWLSNRYSSSSSRLAIQWAKSAREQRVLSFFSGFGIIKQNQKLPLRISHFISLAACFIFAIVFFFERYVKPLSSSCSAYFTFSPISCWLSLSLFLYMCVCVYFSRNGIEIKIQLIFSLFSLFFRCLAAAVVKTSSSVQLKQPKAEHAKD